MFNLYDYQQPKPQYPESLIRYRSSSNIGYNNYNKPNNSIYNNNYHQNLVNENRILQREKEQLINSLEFLHQNHQNDYDKALNKFRQLSVENENLENEKRQLEREVKYKRQDHEEECEKNRKLEKEIEQERQNFLSIEKELKKQINTLRMEKEKLEQYLEEEKEKRKDLHERNKSLEANNLDMFYHGLKETKETEKGAFQLIEKLLQT